MQSVTCQTRPLSASGFGVEAVFAGGPADPVRVREVALGSGVALVRNCAFTEDEFRAFVGRMGAKVSYDDDDAAVGYGFTDILHLDGSPDAEKVVTGRGGLPLHTDGVLLGTQVDLIILYAAELGNLGEHGATIVCDQLAAWQAMPGDLRAVIDAGTLEYRALERGYFTTTPDGWYEIPTVRDYGRVRSLNLALPFAPGGPASWDVRVPGVTATESAGYFSRLADYLSGADYLYTHVWQQGDLLVVDNQRTLHGRRGLADDSTRKLLRGQVTI